MYDIHSDDGNIYISDLRNTTLMVQHVKWKAIQGKVRLPRTNHVCCRLNINFQLTTGELKGELNRCYGLKIMCGFFPLRKNQLIIFLHECVWSDIYCIL